jgi:pyruvate-formate lyase
MATDFDPIAFLNDDNMQKVMDDPDLHQKFSMLMTDVTIDAIAVILDVMHRLELDHHPVRIYRATENHHREIMAKLTAGMSAIGMMLHEKQQADAKFQAQAREGERPNEAAMRQAAEDMAEHSALD